MTDPVNIVAEVCNAGQCAQIDPTVGLIVAVIAALEGELKKKEPFGPNNEIVKALNTIIADLKNGAGPNNDIVNGIQNLISDLKNGPGPNNDIIKALKSIFPNI